MFIEPLSRHRYFRTADPDVARAAMSGILREHRLDPGASTMEASCNVVRYGDIGLVYKHYGVRVRIRTEPIGTFRLVQIPLAGWARVLNGTADIAFDPAVASVPDPDASLDMNWHESSRQLLVRFDRAALDDHLRRMLGRVPDRPLRMAMAMHLRSPAARTWLESLRMLQTDAEGPGLFLDPRLRPQVEQLMMSQFLLAQPNSYTEFLLDVAPGKSTPRPIRLAEQLITDHAHEMLTITDIAEAVGLSVRSLQEGFRRYLDTTPTARLREARLVGVHAALTAADPTTTTVAAVAADWGFWHLGRFAALYRRRWGVPPAVTLRG
ncbi:AraC family transcriptional regulator [Nocardia beijingensis]|uniref:AraC family transcriptional regulator n=1 Tax=Nocardia beijingensis TaxID=95162 RepID=UPI00082AB9B1|nr:helix-turn-helix domain-containing protein [Nocardia beijingensis]